MDSIISFVDFEDFFINFIIHFTNFADLITKFVDFEDFIINFADYFFIIECFKS